MTTPKPIRKTRSDKFPLTLHKTGQFCKKIKGKIYYFGNDKQKALQHYLEQASFLHGGHKLVEDPADSSITLKHLCNLYLDYQKSRVDVDELTSRPTLIKLKAYAN